MKPKLEQDWDIFPNFASEKRFPCSCGRPQGPPQQRDRNYFTLVALTK